ncbi:hypothetical protein FZEAL_7162 [Fusarium zealandicum]|uniref:NAD(P)-binding domain-containing protein n=1 Tax=Fusarium zealandicum TaxID=1053134 RepID=A0A8H4UH38_9HYPO|nr:hypothetical protein FZEAL_7162 [Fusarium zealandicum]
MVRVAIAGGSNGLGRVITSAIVSEGKHDVFVLSRRAATEDKTNSALNLQVDYTDPDKIAQVLTENKIEVVISAIGVLFEDTHLAQMNLIEGAERSSTVRRFAPSDFGIDYVEADKQGYPCVVPGLEGYKGSKYKLQALERVKATKLEYTRYVIGFLMDYYGFPAETIPVQPLAVILDMDNHAAAIPGTGNDKITLTHSETIGKFVSASLDLEKWPETSWIIGDTLTWREALEIVQDAQHKEFDVKFDSEEALKASQITELPANIPRYAIAGKPFLSGILSVWSLGFIWGWFDISSAKGEDKALNEILPQVETLSFATYIKRCWQ